MAEILSAVEKSRNGDLSNNSHSDVAAILQPEQLASAPKNDDTHESKKPTTWSDCEAPNQPPVKRRKTRRGKTRRRNATHPYMKPGSTVISKPEAPYNSNRFLIEDHGDDLDDDFDEVKPDQASTSTVTRTRDSSFSMEDSDGPTDPTPYCEFPTLIKDFDNQYESLQVERLQSMSKDELIQEFMRFERMMERKVDVLVEQLKKRKGDGDKCQNDDCRKEVQRLTLENDILRQENDSMKASMNLSTDSDDSADSESDSEDSSDSVSDSSTSSLSPSRPPTPPDSNPSSGGEHNQQPVQPVISKE